MQQLFQKYFHKVKFYPSTDNFTQALLVMLVTNITFDITMCQHQNMMMRVMKPKKAMTTYTTTMMIIMVSKGKSDAPSNALAE